MVVQVSEQLAWSNKYLQLTIEKATMDLELLTWNHVKQSFMKYLLELLGGSYSAKVAHPLFFPPLSN